MCAVPYCGSVRSRFGSLRFGSIRFEQLPETSKLLIMDALRRCLIRAHSNKKRSKISLQPSDDCPSSRLPKFLRECPMRTKACLDRVPEKIRAATLHARSILRTAALET